MVATARYTEPTYLYRAWRGLQVTRNDGDIVRLSWKQLASLMLACVAPAIAFSGALWYWAERVVITEQTNAFQDTRIATIEGAIQVVQQRDGTLYRIEQHLVDVDRQLTEIREELRQDNRKAGP